MSNKTIAEERGITGEKHHFTIIKTVNRKSRFKELGFGSIFDELIISAINISKNHSNEIEKYYMTMSFNTFIIALKSGHNIFTHSNMLLSSFEHRSSFLNDTKMNNEFKEDILEFMDILDAIIYRGTPDILENDLVARHFYSMPSSDTNDTVGGLCSDTVATILTALLI